MLDICSNCHYKLKTLKAINKEQKEIIKLLKQDFGKMSLNIFEKIEKAMEKKKDE